MRITDLRKARQSKALLNYGGERGIRTLDTGVSPYNGLAILHFDTPPSNPSYLQAHSRTRRYAISPHSAVNGHLNGQRRKKNSFYTRPHLPLFPWFYEKGLRPECLFGFDAMESLVKGRQWQHACVAKKRRILAISPDCDIYHCMPQDVTFPRASGSHLRHAVVIRPVVPIPNGLRGC